MSSLKLLETNAFIPMKPVLFKKRKKKEMEICFICNVTVVDVLQYNHMFVKLFVPCKLKNQTILGFQSAFVSENVFASIEMYHQSSCILVFKWIVCNLYKIRLLLVMYIVFLCTSSIGLDI